MVAENNSEFQMKDLVSLFARRWKNILAMTVICNVFLGGWQHFSVKKAHDVGGLMKEEARFEQELADYQWSTRFPAYGLYLFNNLSEKEW